VVPVVVIRRSFSGSTVVVREPIEEHGGKELLIV
jgi:hypothetical protein